MTRSERSPVVQQVPAPLLTVTEVDPAADERLETVVERLAAAGPSGIAPPHCWFCGKVEAWFRCDCKDAIEAREGRRNRPRVIERNGQMFVILDPDIIERNRAWGRKRYACSGRS